MQKKLALFCFVMMLVSGCTKTSKEDCPSAENIEITSNSPVVAGWPLELKVLDVPGVLYHWKGPNGYDVQYDYYTNSAFKQLRNNMTLADAGEYSLELLNERGCAIYRGKVTVEVLEPPAQPCSLSPNTGISNFVNIGSGTNYRVLVHGTAVEASQPGETIHLHFPGTAIQPGIYKTSGYWPMDDKTVGLYSTLFPYDFISRPDQLVYVTKNSSGKYEFGFCDHLFSNPLGGTAPKISARLVEY